MCVRTCDGYYFPVSFATGKGRLRKDARSCKASCGAPARLYYYPNPGGEPEDMVSYRGEKKYKKLKNAFLFRKEFVADCRCKAEPWTQSSKKRHLQYAVVETKASEKTGLVEKAAAQQTRLAASEKTSQGKQIQSAVAEKTCALCPQDWIKKDRSHQTPHQVQTSDIKLGILSSSHKSAKFFVLVRNMFDARPLAGLNSRP